MHIKHIPRAIKRRVVREMYDDHPEYLGQTAKKSKKDKEKDKAGTVLYNVNLYYL